MEKPPIGIKPRELWWAWVLNIRMRELLAAMERYCAASKKIPQEWIDELKEHNRTLSA